MNPCAAPMSSEEVFQVTSFHPPAVKSSSSLFAIRYNFLPDSVDKNSGTLSVAHTGEVNLNFAGNRNCKSCVNDHFYSGNQSVAKDFEYVLIVDRKNKTARIEKIHNSISLRNIRRSRRLSSGNDRSGSPVSVPISQKRSYSNTDEDDEIESLNSEIFNDFI